MSRRLSASAVGPAGSRAVRRLDAGRALLAVVATVRGEAAEAERRRLEAGIVRAVVGGHAAAGGSRTARLRAGIVRAHEWCRLESGQAEAVVHAALNVGVTVALAEAGQAVVALVGPAAARGTGGEWLAGAADVQGAVPAAAPASGQQAAPGGEPRKLGAGTEPDIRWGRWTVAGAATLLLAGPEAAEPPPDAQTGSAGWAPLDPLLALNDPTGAAVLLRWTAPDVPVRRAGLTRTAAGLGRLAEWARPAVRAAARNGALVLRATLPDRGQALPAVPAAGSRRRAQYWAAAALILPPALVAFSLAARAARGPTAGWPAAAPAPRPPDSTPVGPGTWIPGGAAAPAAGPADGARVLADLSVAGSLAGPADDERHLVVAEGAAYVLDVPAHEVLRWQDSAWSAVLERGAVAGDEVAGNFVDLLWLPPGPHSPVGRVAALDAGGVLWALGGGKVQVVPRPAEPAFELAELAAASADGLFVIDRARDQILWFAPDPSAYPSFRSGREWLAQPLDMAAAADIALGDAVYVLWQGGRIAKFASGVEEPFHTEAAVPVPLDAPAIYTDADAGRLLVADRSHGRVIVLSPDGALLDRLAAPTRPDSADDAARQGRLQRLQDVWWDRPAGRVYLLCGNTLLAASYSP